MEFNEEPNNDENSGDIRIKCNNGGATLCFFENSEY